MRPIRVVVAGATGKTGRSVVKALCNSEDVEVVGAVGRTRIGTDLGAFLGQDRIRVVVSSDILETLRESRAQVLVDFTMPSAALANSLTALDMGVAVVVGTTGIDPSGYRSMKEIADRRGVAAIAVPNFSVGALLLFKMMRQAAPYFQGAEVFDMCRIEKTDSPSGTAMWLASGISDVGPIPISMHSVRLPGLVSQHSVLLARSGETLLITHNIISFDVFGEGVLLAVRRARELRGLITDVDDLMGSLLRPTNSSGGEC